MFPLHEEVSVKTLSAALLGLFLLLSITSVELASAEAKPSYSKDVKPFLAKYCTEFHNAKEAKRGYNLESYAGLTKAGKRGAAVVPGKADQSLAWKTMMGQGRVMPPKKFTPRPTKDEIAL